MRVRIDNLSHHFGQTSVLQGISLDIEDHELFFLLGPSGCGKTTLLRLVAGFYQPDEGRIYFGDKLMNGVAPHRRNTGMVFQNYALWPHMTVAENVAYGLEVRSLGSPERKQRVADALAIVQMEAYAGRTPNQLSGGQQQRVALARALVIQPDVLLLDEPLSNLDAKLRQEMRDEIRRIHEHTRITTIYVTHDQKESLSLADRIAVMRAGVIEQIGEPRTVYRSPGSRFVTDFMAETNWLPGTVQASTSTELVLQNEFGHWQSTPNPTMSPGQSVWIGFRPEAVEISQDTVNGFSAKVAHVTYLGEIEQYSLELSPTVQVKALEQNPERIRPRGEIVRIHIAPQSLLVFPARQGD
jgi:iron(III) transport system ATP-binding protein